LEPILRSLANNLFALKTERKNRECAMRSRDRFFMKNYSIRIHEFEEVLFRDFLKIYFLNICAISFSYVNAIILCL